jgi:hypothetical protein
MAGAQLSLTRRALLGAAFAPVAFAKAPVIPAQAGTPARPAPSSSPWDPGLRRDDVASAVLKWDRALARFGAGEDLEERFGDLDSRRLALLRRLLRTPAPSLATLARKLDLALDERSGEFDGDAAAMKALKRDARRLAAASA